MSCRTDSGHWDGKTIIDGMADINVDINETEIFNIYPEVLDTLLKDHTTGRNIFWATDSYAYRGNGFQYDDAITVENITGENGMVINIVLNKIRE